jgi:hypothetical protein
MQFPNRTLLKHSKKVWDHENLLLTVFLTENRKHKTENFSGWELENQEGIAPPLLHKPESGNEKMVRRTHPTYLPEGSWGTIRKGHYRFFTENRKPKRDNR